MTFFIFVAIQDKASSTNHRVLPICISMHLLNQQSNHLPCRPTITFSPHNNPQHFLNRKRIRAWLTYMILGDGRHSRTLGIVGSGFARVGCMRSCNFAKAYVRLRTGTGTRARLANWNLESRCSLTAGYAR
jgi:hypothetical protein